MSFRERRVLLSVVLQGEQQELMFDSGSSAFTLLTSPGSWKQLAQPAATTQTIPVKSWGKTLTENTLFTDAAMQLGVAIVPVGKVTYIEGMSFMQNTLTRFSGMTACWAISPSASTPLFWM